MSKRELKVVQKEKFSKEDWIYFRTEFAKGWVEIYIILFPSI